MTVRPSTVWRRTRWVVGFVALCTLATCPAALERCRVEDTVAEAPTLLRYLLAQVRGYVKDHGALPAIAAGPTPPIGTCCATGSTCAVDRDRWLDPTWRALGFSIDGPHRYSYEVAKDGDALVLRAIGDLDCDSVVATVEVRLTLVDGRLVEAWSETNRYE